MMKKTTKVFYTTIIMAYLGFCFGWAGPALADPPLAVVKANVTEVLKVLREEFPDKAEKNALKRGRVWDIANRMFDFRELSRRTLGKNWAQLTAQQQDEFTDLFSTHLGNVYMDRILAYTDEKVVFDRERKKRNRALVYSRVITNAAEIPINYSMIEKGGAWRVYDVVIEGVSLVSNYRSQFTEILQKEGPDHLIGVLRKKVDEKA